MTYISIHAAREGGDLGYATPTAALCIFQSTPPVKAATRHQASPPSPSREFQSTPPVKAATIQAYARISSSEFQSTPPVKAATKPFSRHISASHYFNPRRP